MGLFFAKTPDITGWINTAVLQFLCCSAGMWQRLPLAAHRQIISVTLFKLSLSLKTLMMKESRLFTIVSLFN